jgi:hypothetical protein
MSLKSRMEKVINLTDLRETRCEDGTLEWK